MPWYLSGLTGASPSKCRFAAESRGKREQSCWPSRQGCRRLRASERRCVTACGDHPVLDKLAVVLAPSEPQLQHAALRLTARGWETMPLPAPNGSGALRVTLDLQAHEAVIEHSDGRERRIVLHPDRPVGDVTRDVLEATRALGGAVEIDPTPQEVSWSVPLDEDSEHSTYDRDQVRAYFAAATRAALVLAEFRAPFQRRSTPVNAWWGSFDLAVSLFSGRPADPPSNDFIPRNAMNVEEVAVGWWPGDERYGKPAFYAYAHPAPEGFAGATLSPDHARWDETLGEYVLDWEDLLRTPHPHELALEFARSVFRHSCEVCEWDHVLAATVDGTPPPVT